MKNRNLQALAVRWYRLAVSVLDLTLLTGFLLQLNTQNMRLWFNKQFDELFALKKREVGLVSERNDRLRFIIEGYLFWIYFLYGPLSVSADEL